VTDWKARVREAREADDPGLILKLIPYASFLGLSFERVEGELVARMRFSDHLIGDSSIPALHGERLARCSESAAIFTAL
jgi:hypothetical protein